MRLMHIWEYERSNDVKISGPSGGLVLDGPDGSNSEIVNFKVNGRGLEILCKLKQSPNDEQRFYLRILTETGKSIANKLLELKKEIIGSTIYSLRNKEIIL